MLAVTSPKMEKKSKKRLSLGTKISHICMMARVVRMRCTSKSPTTNGKASKKCSQTAAIRYKMKTKISLTRNHTKRTKRGVSETRCHKVRLTCRRGTLEWTNHKCSRTTNQMTNKEMTTWLMQLTPTSKPSQTQQTSLRSRRRALLPPRKMAIDSKITYHR